MKTLNFIRRLFLSLFGPRFSIAGNLDAADLAAVAFGGLINEEVMQQIWDISAVPLPFTDMISEDGIKNSFATWTQDTLAAPATDNKQVDGADTTSINDTATGARVGNHAQISVKVVQVSSRADASDTVGKDQELAYQVMMRQRELKRDMEAQMLTQLPSVADDGAAVAGQSAGLGAWLETNVSFGVTGSAGGFNTGTGVVDAPTSGTTRALSETFIRDMAESVYVQGGDPKLLMSTTTVIRGLSEYMFTSSARIATLTSDVQQSRAAVVATGAANVFITDFDVVMTMVANRLQQEVAADNATLFLVDPQFARVGVLRGLRVEPLSKTGLSEKRQMSMDYTLKVLTEKAHGGIFDINPTLAVVA